MIKKRKVLLISLFVFLIFILTINYLMKILNDTQNKVIKNELQIEDKIWYEFKRLPQIYKERAIFIDNITDNYLNNINNQKSVSNILDLWSEANSWTSKKQLVNFSSINIGNMIYALKTEKITRVDVDTRGTQLKLLLTLSGDQEAIFKPKWYEKEKIIEGPVYAGKDRYGAEILSFYLAALLDTPLIPLCTERTLSLKHDVIPVATKRLIDTSFERNNSICIYGKCFYCTKHDPVCDDVNGKLSGAIIFNIKDTFKVHRSPWQRTYKKGKKAAWEESNHYCKIVSAKLHKQRVLDLIDTSIFDFLIQNGDRHHYETLNDKVVLIDNGKGLGNPNVHHIDILAPLYQCCMLRNKTWKRLQSLSGGFLIEKLKNIPDIYNFVTEEHLQAIDERLLLIYATVEYCRNRNKIKYSLF